ncbi:MAG: hypothetical protein Fur0024_3010 [Patescibacteria group bacterium]
MLVEKDGEKFFIVYTQSQNKQIRFLWIYKKIDSELFEFKYVYNESLRAVAESFGFELKNFTPTDKKVYIYPQQVEGF